MKQDQGTTTGDRERQNVTSRQQPASSSQKDVSNRKDQEEKKINVHKPNERRDPR